jgi:hypothetical protein
MKYIYLLSILFVSCQDAALKKDQESLQNIKEKADFMQMVSEQENITALLVSKGMKKQLDTVYLIADTNVTAAKEYYNNLTDKVLK